MTTELARLPNADQVARVQDELESVAGVEEFDGALEHARHQTVVPPPPAPVAGKDPR